MMKKRYHSELIKAYQLGLEKKLIPFHIQKEIPKTTIHYWRNNKQDQPIGSELGIHLKYQLKDLKFINQNINTTEIKILRFLVQMKITFKDLLYSKEFNKTIHKNKDLLINTLESNKNIFPIKFIGKLFNFSPQRYAYWKKHTITQCDQSPIGLCYKQHGLQLPLDEVKQIASWCKKKTHIHWPLSSIYGEARKKHDIKCSRSTFYKYTKLLGITKRKASKKPKYKALIAKYSNQYWHVDITIFKTINGVKNYIYIIMDNYSRKILGYQIASHISAIIAMTNLKETIKKHLKPGASTTLISDGGAENKNNLIKNIIDHNNIHHKIALKDITYSNSAVEAVNKIVKYQYLFKKEIKDQSALKTYLKEIVEDYNNRPHYKHELFSPNEAYGMKNIKAEIKKFKLQQAKRKKHKEYCKICV